MKREAPSRTWLGPFMFVALTAAYFFSNPYWFGDAVWYAFDISTDGGHVRLDAGHLAWRPIGYATWRLLSVTGLDTDPLDALRLISSAATALLCFATYRLARHFLGNDIEALAAAALVALTKVSLAYGGSGSSYTAAMAMCTVAFIPLVASGGREWSLRDAGASCLALTAGWACWGTSVLVLPGLFVAAALYSRGSVVRRVLRAGLLCGVTAFLLIGVAGASYAAFRSASNGSSFFGWLQTASHGRPLELSPLGFARAVYGLFVSFVHLGDMGTIVKTYFLDGSLIPLFVGVMVVVIGATAAGFMLLASSRVQVTKALAAMSGRSIELVVIAVATFLPVAAFAVAWKGSDVERFSLAVPMLTIAVVRGSSRLRLFASQRRPHTAVAAWSLVAIVGVINLSTYIMPAIVTHGGLTMAIGRVALQHVPPGSLLVVAGHDLFGDVIGPSAYFYRISVHNFTFDVVDQGLDGYEDRLRNLVGRTLSSGGKIAVISDLLGRPTPGGIGLDEREHPDPSMEELTRLFASWQVEGDWKVDRYTFVVVRPPESWSDAYPEAARGGSPRVSVGESRR